MPMSPHDPGLNLDSIPREDLLVLALHLRTLAEYAKRKAEALAFREGGQIGSAQRLEAVCEELYADLPTNWRW
jgi:hypothetical protein